MASRGSSRMTGLAASTEPLSFLLFCGLSLVGALIFPAYYVVFLIVVVVDGTASIAGSDLVVALDRSAYFMTVIILAVAASRSDILLLFAGVLFLLVSLDFSFLLRGMRNTQVDIAVVKRRVESYAETAVPAFLVSYLLTLLYSFFFTAAMALPDPLELLAISTTVALLIVYIVARFLLLPPGRRSSRRRVARLFP